MASEKICYGDNIVVEGHRLALSLAVRAGDTVYMYAEASRDTTTLKPADPCGLKVQTTHRLELIKMALDMAGATLEEVVKLNVILKNREDLDGYNDTIRKYFPEKPPARITTLGDYLLEGALIEIDATAYSPRD
ncbi:MAG: RidA family protein [Gammaproteobacteria bacterium]|nr:RidA family protein [Gammaproteobacteria bacterium]